VDESSRASSLINGPAASRVTAGHALVFQPAKVGYDGPLTFELSPRGFPKDALARARQATARTEN
jgi:hypothetical protein